MKKTFFLKIIQWTLGMQFWQTLFLTKKIFRFFSKNDKKLKILREKNPQNVTGVTQNAVWAFPSKENMTKDQKRFAECPKKVTKRFFQKQMILRKTFLWSRWLRFWQPCRTNEKKCPAVFAQCPKMLINFFSENKIYLKKFQRTWTTEFWRPYWKIWDQKPNFFAQCPKVIKKFSLLRKTVKIFLGTRRRQIGLHRREIVHKAPEILRSMLDSFCLKPEKDNEIFLQKKNSTSKSWNGPVQRSFEHPIGKFRTTSRNCSAQGPKMVKKTYFQGKKIPFFPFENFLLTCWKQLWRSRSNFVARSQQIQQCPDVLKKHFFHKQLTLLKMFLRTRRTQFWQPRQKNFDKKGESFGQCPKMMSNHFSEETYFTKFSYGREKSIVYSPAEEILTECWTVYPHCPKVMKSHFYQKQMFLQNCSYGNAGWLNDNPADQNRKNPNFS